MLLRLCVVLSLYAVLRVCLCVQTFACQNHVRAVLRVGSQLFVCATGVDAPIVYYLNVSRLYTRLKLPVTCYLSCQFCPCSLFHRTCNCSPRPCSYYSERATVHCVIVTVYCTVSSVTPVFALDVSYQLKNLMSVYNSVTKSVLLVFC